MATKQLKKATVKSTREFVEVYKLTDGPNRGKYQDYKGMGANEPPTAIKSGKKVFSQDELEFLK